MAKYILSSFADEYSDNLIEQCEGMKSLGIEYIEIRHANGKAINEMSYDDLKENKKVMDYYGIKTNSVGSPLGKIKIDDDFEKHLDLTKKMCEFACILDTKYIRMFSFYPRDGKSIDEDRDEVIYRLDKMLDIADEYNVQMCHENESNIYGETAENCLDILDYFKGRLKCTFDMGNFVFENHDAYAAYLLLKDRIEYFHIKDALDNRIFVPSGYGNTRMEDILGDYIKTATHDTFLTVEPHLFAFEGLNSLAHEKFNTSLSFKDNKESFTYAKEALDKILERI